MSGKYFLQSGLRVLELLVKMDIVYEDKDKIILNMPAGQLSQSGKSFEMDLVCEVLTYRKSKGEEAYAAIINRLDRPVSGLVLMAKNKKEAARLSGGETEEEKISEKAAETFAWFSAEMKLLLNDDHAKIAEMMIDGANMGIKSITEKRNRYPEAEKESISLAKKFERVCEKIVKDMKKYI